MGARETRRRAASATPPTFKADKAGKYLLLAAAVGDDHYKVMVDGKQVLEQDQVEGQHPESTSLDLTAGQTINVVADYLPGFAGNRFSLGVANEAGHDLRGSEEICVCSRMWWWSQSASIRPPRARASTAPSIFPGVRMRSSRPWPRRIRTPSSLSPAAAEWTYALARQGARIAAHLVSRAGRRHRRRRQFSLASTIPRAGCRSASTAVGTRIPRIRITTPSRAQTPCFTSPKRGHPPVDYVIPQVKYEDKLMVGYRYWTTTGKHPLFPFGFGLSYTTFSFSKLEAPATAASGSAVPVSFDVTNTGSVAGAEVAQLYVSDPSATVKRPERELKGFEKIRLERGETKHVTITLDARSFSYWDETTHNWKIDPGKFVLLVGDSSENTPLHAELTVK